MLGMGKSKGLCGLCFVILSVWMIDPVIATGREVPLLHLQRYHQKPSSGLGVGFSNLFNTIYDTSKYGILQLNNGLGHTPQMGFVSLSLSHHVLIVNDLFSLFLFIE